MPFQLLTAERADIPEIAIIHHEAFKDDPIIGRLMCDVEPQLKKEYDIQYYEKSFAQAHLIGNVMHKIIDTETGKIVAASKWIYPVTLTPEQEAQKEELNLSRSYPEGTNVELYEGFFKEIDAKRKHYCNNERDYFLHILIVSPDYQRRGLGSMLIREGLAAADRDNAKAYIEASPKGLQLYLRHGWKVVDRVEVDMTPHRGKGVAVEELLFREPGTGIGAAQ
ncbi:MAG: hypothetical protein Q9219_005061 [cf. Caloplaca sp. 3 TL-2023]